MNGRPRVPVAPCRFCNREFKRQEHLARHLRTHTKERPFPCSCGRLFSRQDLLSRHRRVSQCSDLHADGHDVQAPSSSVAAVPATLDAPSAPTHVGRLVPMSSASSHAAGALPVVGSDPESAMSGGSDMVIMDKPTPAGYSQDHYLMKDVTDQGPEHRQETAIDGRVSSFGHYGMAHATDVAMHQAHPFDLDFLPNEASIMNDYLNGVFGPVGSPGLLLAAPFDSYGFIDMLSGEDMVRPRDARPLGAGLPSMSSPGRLSVHQPTNVQGKSPKQVSDESAKSSDAIDDILVTADPWAISSAAYERLEAMIAEHETVLPEPFSLPSRHGLSRLVKSWVRGFHPHLPLLHLPTTSLDSMNPILLLTLAASGSFYGFEHTHGYSMCVIAKSIICRQLEHRRRAATLPLLGGLPQYAELGSHSSPSNQTSSPSTPSVVDIELLQALVVLIMTMSWLDGPLAQDALAISSQLASLMREALKNTPPSITTETWVDWAREEEKRRTIYSSYFVLNILTICFNVPPYVSISELSLSLPFPEAEFKAPTAGTWQGLRTGQDTEQPNFLECFKQLLCGRVLKHAAVTEFGHYMLLQSLLVQILFERQAVDNLLSSTGTLSPAAMSRFEGALTAWQSCRDAAADSTLDPSMSPRGPIPFNSVAVLRMAHIHLCVGLQSHCELLTRDPRVVALAFEPDRNPIPLHTPHLDEAVLHAICALRILVRVGIAFVARGRTGHWSVQHALSNFACAILLTHWLENVYNTACADGLDGVRPEERRLLVTLERLIEETHLEGLLGPKDLYPGRIRRLAAAAVKLWAETCKGVQVYEIVHVIGQALSIVAESTAKRA